MPIVPGSSPCLTSNALSKWRRSWTSFAFSSTIWSFVSRRSAMSRVSGSRSIRSRNTSTWHMLRRSMITSTEVIPSAVVKYI